MRKQQQQKKQKKTVLPTKRYYTYMQTDIWLKGKHTTQITVSKQMRASI